MRPDALGVIGLGAIGGSLAWRATQLGIARVIGYSPLPAESVTALRAGAITEIAEQPLRVLERAELVVLAAPPAANVRLLEQAAPVLLRRRALCTDVTSVKRPIVAAAERLALDDVFAGSHPFAGTHESGFAAARPALLERALVYVTPLANGERAAREVADFWTVVCAAAPVFHNAADHDRLLGWTSHLPQAVASALAAALARFGPRAVTYGSGARDTTRLAAGSTEVWRELLLLNRDAVLRALDGLDDEVGRLRAALVAGDERALAQWLEAGQRWRRRLGS